MIPILPLDEIEEPTTTPEIVAAADKIFRMFRQKAKDLANLIEHDACSAMGTCPWRDEHAWINEVRGALERYDALRSTWQPPES